MTFFTLLGFAKKSNKLVCGMTNCLYAVHKKKAKLVIIAADAGETRKKVVRECRLLDIPILEFGNKDQYFRSLGGNPSCYLAVLSREIAEDLMKEYKQYGGD